MRLHREHMILVKRMYASWLFRNLDVDTDNEWRWLDFETWIDLWLVLFLRYEMNSLHFFLHFDRLNFSGAFLNHFRTRCPIEVNQ